MRFWFRGSRSTKARRDVSAESHGVPLGELLGGFGGKWVAIKNRHVVAAAETPYALLGALREKGLKDAAVIRAPAAEEPEMVGFG